MADLDTIMSGREDDSVQAPEVAAPQPSPPPAEQPQGTPRDEHGRFASQQPAPAPVEQQPEGTQRPPDGYIPIQALDARLAKERERHDAALRQQAEQFEQRMRASLPPPPKPEPAPKQDWYENPDAAIDQRLEPVVQGQQAIREDFSRMLATEKFGEDAVRAAFQEMATRMSTQPGETRFDYQRIMSSPHPFGELVKWHKAQSALKTYGDDPEAAINAEVERRLAERGQQPATPPASLDPKTLPSSFAAARNSGPAATPAWNGPRPLSEIKPN